MFWMVQQTFLFPIMILSGMLLPLETGPGWMQALAKANPLAYVLDAERALFAGDVTADPVVAGFVAAAATAVVGLAVGIRVMLKSAD
jgi:ABC-2 type transport system permease protein